MKTYSLFVVLCFYLSACRSQTDWNIIENWKSYPIPTDRDTLSRYNNSPNYWKVFMQSDSVRVIKAPPEDDQSIIPFKLNPNEKERPQMIGKVSILKVDDGYLLGFFRGEWGGYMYWFSKDGKHHYLISEVDVVQFIGFNNHVYAIEGLAHLGLSEGSILSLQKKNGKWISSEYLKLPAAPEAIAVYGNNFIIITSKSLLEVDDNLKTTTLVEKGILYYLDPNSLIIHDNIVYAGMQAGVYKYNLLSKQQEWLMPN